MTYEDSYVFFIFSISGVEDILEVEPSSSSNMGDNETLNSTGLEMFGLHVNCNYTCSKVLAVPF